MTTLARHIRRVTDHLGRAPIILWDLDGNVYDWGDGWDKTIDVVAPGMDLPRAAEHRDFDLTKGLTDEQAIAVGDVMAAIDYYSLEPYEGAVEAMQEAEAAGAENYILTSPWWPSRTCLQGKADAVLRDLGPKWQSKLILSSHKHLNIGDILMDDRPNIRDADKATWSQILFDQPYNQDSPLPRVTDWREWTDVLIPVLDQHVFAGAAA